MRSRRLHINLSGEAKHSGGQPGGLCFDGCIVQVVSYRYMFYMARTSTKKLANLAMLSLPTKMLTALMQTKLWLDKTCAGLFKQFESNSWYKFNFLWTTIAAKKIHRKDLNGPPEERWFMNQWEIKFNNLMNQIYEHLLRKRAVLGKKLSLSSLVSTSYRLWSSIGTRWKMKIIALSSHKMVIKGRRLYWWPN